METRCERLKAILKQCRLCPRECGIDRSAGERGWCGLDAGVVVKCALPHWGEEPPISGDAGAGTIFFSSCNLGCVYCQNYRISHDGTGHVVATEDLARMMLSLQDAGCHNIELVTPTPHIAGIAEAWRRARDGGLGLPVVYNSGGYELPDIISLLDGLVDVYLPDFKYGCAEDARALSGVSDYAPHALAALREMVRQVGERLEVEGEVAKRGIIVRHLVLPGREANSRRALSRLRDTFSTVLPISIMAQYTPTPAAEAHPDLGRRVTREEYEHIINFALDLGFEEIYIQDVDDLSLTPDFDRDDPFVWGREDRDGAGQT